MWLWCFFFFFACFWGWGAPEAYRSSQARGGIRALAARLHHSHSSLIFNLHQSSRQCRILNPLMEARDWTCVLVDPSQIRFHWAMRELQFIHFFEWMHCCCLKPVCLLIFFGHAHGMQMFWGQGWNPRHGSDPNHCSDWAGSHRDATRELWSYLSSGDFIYNISLQVYLWMKYPIF